MRKFKASCFYTELKEKKMSFLQKVLFVLTIGIFGRSVDANGVTELNLPKAPGLHETRVLASEQHPVGGLIEVALDGIFIQLCNKQIVIREKKTALHVARYYEPYEQIYIYFPKNGHQPITVEAVRYSCANIDNRESSPITEWYMKMFGYIAPEKAAIEAGFSRGSNNPQKIINFDLVPAPKVGSIMNADEQNQFWNTFRQIATNPSGRILLYRLLIEIRRSAAITNDGSVGDDIIHKPTATLEARNNCRCINITRYDKNTFVYTTDGCGIRLNFDDNKYVSILSSEKGTGTEGRHYRTIIRHKRKSDIGLFHEMIHWYHRLRHIIRYNHEKSHGEQKQLSDIISVADRPDITIGNYYYKNIPDAVVSGTTKDQRRENSAKVWNEDGNTQYEEIRAIIGVPAELDGYLNGDEISENLYRLHTSDPNMRFAHTLVKYYEDDEVLDRAKNVSERTYHLINRHSRMFVFPHANSAEHKPEKSYNDTINIGLGACKK